ncbi:MAG: four helix bundle protein [Alphaproteobacteria bacterium PRO2]|nr:four helix bundle protein [Alphaproteobacteria bacterium PRO2]
MSYAVKENNSLDSEKLIRSFEDLHVYQKAFEISLDIHRESKKFPQSEQFSLADQIRRASKSICANIAEGFGKQGGSKKDFKRYLVIALGSAHEMLVCIKYCEKLELISTEKVKLWREEYLIIIKMLRSFHAKII